MDKNVLRLYAITDRAWLKDNEKLSEAVEQAIIGGASIIQLREKALPYNELKELAFSVKQVCNRYNVPFIINDNVKLAKEIDADGVHVGASDMAVSEARAILGPEKIVGATAKTIEQAVAAQKDGADYLGSGAIFGTTTKLDAKPMTMELLNSICSVVDIPVVAIGGIDANNVSMLKDSKIAGVAVVSGIFARNNKIKAAHEIIRNLYGTPVIHCITNQVTMNNVANIVLAAGGSPIMAHHVAEVEEIQNSAKGLLVNLGATDDYEAIKLAYKVALVQKHPIVIDPVGVGGSSFRRNFLNDLLEMGSPTVIRGNAGEIRAIYEDINTMKGLDSSELADESLIVALAKKLSCIVVATGEIDIISDGVNILQVHGGSTMQKAVTGAGCMLSGLLTTLLSISNNYDINIISWILSCYKKSATVAENETVSENKGSMTFLQKWIDEIYVLFNN